MSDDQPRDRGWAVRLVLGMWACAMALSGLAGCRQSLFDRGVQRSQFETYDSVRNRHASDSYEDAFGRRRINLRGRLLQEE